MNKFTCTMIGLAAGLAGGYILGVKMTEKKARQEVSEARDRYAKKMAQALYGKESAPEEEETPEKPKEKFKPEEKQEFVDYTKFSRKVGGLVEKPPLEELVEDLEKEPTEILIVPEEHFNQNPDDLEQISLTYYEEDGVLTDDKDEMIHNVETLIGNIDLMSLDETTYVENRKMNVLFEINLYEGSYSEIVLGITEEEPTQKSRKRKEEDD